MKGQFSCSKEDVNNYGGGVTMFCDIKDVHGSLLNMQKIFMASLKCVKDFHAPPIVQLYWHTIFEVEYPKTFQLPLCGSLNIL